MPQSVPIIDLFAGPGGLGEGFSAYHDARGRRAFKIGLSIEKDADAHRTLELRAFYRQFTDRPPGEYYRYLAGEISRDDLFDAYPAKAEHARAEAWNAELGVTPPEEVSRRIKNALAGTDEWLLIGGPPCQAYSLVGRSKMIGETSRKEYEADPRHTLYREYLRIIAEHRPPVFVMENVKGLLSATRNGESTLSRILGDLKHPLAAIYGPRHRQGELQYHLVSLAVPRSDQFGEHNHTDFIVRAEDYGVPQARHRLIIVGIRDGVLRRPGLLTMQPQLTVDDAIGDLPPLRSGLSKESDSTSAWYDVLQAIRHAAWLESKQVDDEVRREIRSQLHALSDNLSRGGESMRPVRPIRSAFHPDWFRPDDVAVVCNHATRSHIRADLHRYLFLAAFARVHGRSPLLEEFPKAILPKHKNVADALKETKFNDRFRVQVANRPATTVVSHISKDGHYFIHPDPSQCRSLTVREAARIQTFPDNYFFEGPRTQQYHQVGNAVPPYLARQIAALIVPLF